MPEILAKLREWVAKIWSPVIADGVQRDSLYARAKVDVAELTEHYSYEQVISRNPSSVVREAPTGRIELTVPYDGSEHFGRQACADVGDAGGEAQIGHLLLAGHTKTDLG